MNKEILHDKEKLAELYNKSGSMVEVAKILGCGETAVHKWIHRFGIQPKPRTMNIKGHKKSDSCKKKLSELAKQRVGSKNPNWRNGATKKGMLLRGRSIRERRRLVLERDNHECQKCGIDMDLHIHHIKQFKDYPELVNDLSNCKTLCAKCHRAIHFPKENLANSVKPQRSITVGNAEPSTSSARWYPDWMSTPTELGACVETIYEKSLKRDYDIVRL
jgi:5-methylcytosine-specific restriction endonuclease McrA